MGYSYSTTIDAISCDRCMVRFSFGPSGSAATYDVAAQRKGWTLWATQNNHFFHYCPECSKSYPRPKSRKTMRQVFSFRERSKKLNARKTMRQVF